ncbi:MAG: 1-acyl-sn-glycerol-3-phosphate acyltransferase [Clostridia bacterium]|nr:1-acyl-sn-glycerol-3-phosphate acyltransferase [Clostridia bacterium]
MNIKVKNVTFEKAMAIQPPKRKKLRKPSRLFQTLVRILSIPELCGAKFSYVKEDMEKAGKGPYLILMNHSSFIDLKIAAKIFWPKRYFIVSTWDTFIGKEWLMKNIGCIPTRKFTPDVSLARDMHRALHEKKTSVLLFPEAGYSFDGRTTTIPRNSGALIKKLNVPVLTVITQGAFLHQPLYNNLHMRKNKVTATVKCLLSKDELAQKSPEEIQAAVDNAFSFDDFAAQYENKTVIDNADRAEGLHRLLYRCPACNAEGYMLGEGETLKCTHCGKTYRMDEYGRMHATVGETEFAHIPDWNDWQRACVQQELLDGSYRMETDVDIAMMVDFKALYLLGKGKLVHDEKGVTLTGCDGKLQCNQAPLFTHGLNVDFYWYEIGDMICISEKGRLYCCFPKDKRVPVSKARFAAEELYKTLKANLTK